MRRLVLLRHGRSVWNLENRFTGWADVEISTAGIEEARAAARRLRLANLDFDRAFCSRLRRATETLWHLLAESDRLWLPTDCDWRLNERHYGDLQGRDKNETTRAFGADQVREWRRGFDSPPPLLPDLAAGADKDELFRRGVVADARYDGVEIPRGESLAQTAARVTRCYEEKIAPRLAAGERILIVSHGNSLRALTKHLCGDSIAEIIKFEIPTATPLVIEWTREGDAPTRYFLRD